MTKDDHVTASEHLDEAERLLKGVHAFDPSQTGVRSDLLLRAQTHALVALGKMLRPSRGDLK